MNNDKPALASEVATKTATSTKITVGIMIFAGFVALATIVLALTNI